MARARKMKTFSQNLFSSLDDLGVSRDAAAKAMRSAQVKNMWRTVVDPIFLEHTNAVYIIEEKGKKVLIVYVDDSLFASELNARREMIRLKLLELCQEDVDEFKIYVSRGRYKKNYPFKGENTTVFAPRPAKKVALSADQERRVERSCGAIPDKHLREAARNAMISGLEVENGKKVGRH
jgi:hypothetical protein